MRVPLAGTLARRAPHTEQVLVSGHTETDNRGKYDAPPLKGLVVPYRSKR